MPEFLKLWLTSLTDEEANELALWFDGADMSNAVTYLVDARPNLHKDWNRDLANEI